MRILPPLKDPTFSLLQDDGTKPRTTGTVITADAGIGTARVLFLGSEITALIAGDAPIPGDSVAMVRTQSAWWCIVAGGGYPSRFPRDLADFATTNPAGTFLSYMLRNGPKRWDYIQGTIKKVDNTYNILEVACSDGQNRVVTAEWAGSNMDVFGFTVDTECLIYRKPTGEAVAIAQSGTPVIAFTSYYPPSQTLFDSPPSTRSTRVAFYLGGLFDPSKHFEYSLTGTADPSHYTIATASPVAFGADSEGIDLEFTQITQPVGAATYFDVTLTSTEVGAVQPGTNVARFILSYSL